MVFAKLQSARPRPPVRPLEPRAEPERRGLSPATFAGILALSVGVTWLALGRRAQPQPGAATSSLPSASTASAPTVADKPAPAPASAPPQAAPELPASAPPGLSDADMRTANELIQKLVMKARIGEADLKKANELCSRYPGEDRLIDIQARLLVSLAADYRSQRRHGEAETLVRRAIALRPNQFPPRSLLIAVLLETNDFAAAERAARDAALLGKDADVQFHLGYALFRQDHNREALEALHDSLAIQETEQARSLYDRIQKTARDERGMAEQQLAHFHVRYDGAEHADVGREILRQLERHYATLVRTFDHQPGAPVPVILFSQEQYYTAAGAPAWSGGAFDGMDGRIRIPIGGLTASLTPEMDGTLIHELTHAFIHDKSRGLAPREVHEGFAQYMEGHRIASRFKASDLKIIADGRAGGVAGFYAEALAFVEYLVNTRGVGGMNDLLKAMAETGDVNSAFQQVHGRDYAGTQQAWRERLKQQYGS